MHSGEVCPPGTFSSTNNAGSCTACDGVTGYSDEEGSTTCLAIRGPCNPAEEIESKAPSPTQNRECLKCGDGGTYNDASGLCKVATTCTPGQYVTKQVTLTTDRECGGELHRTHAHIHVWLTFCFSGIDLRFTHITPYLPSMSIHHLLLLLYPSSPLLCIHQPLTIARVVCYSVRWRERVYGDRQLPNLRGGCVV